MTRAVAALRAAGLLLLPALGAPLAAEDASEVDPCVSAQTDSEARSCWAAEAARADREMRQALERLVGRLPREAAERLRKAQRLWLDFRDAHLTALVAGRDRRDPQRILCLLITKRQLARERTRQLEEMSQADAGSACTI
jgi:uncharacterized protein YecT (DUF1311 family)